MSVKILIGDNREQLRGLAANSVHMIVTSPPYWGLRDYGIPPQVFGGDDGCEHEWGDTVAVNATNHTGKARWNHTRNGRDEEQPTEKRVSSLHTEVKQGQYCQRCGAWAGAHGLEPTPQLFVANEVLIFRECFRVLRDDGTLWLNLGDSYAGSGRGGNPTEDSSTLQGGQDSQKASMIKRTRGADEIGSSARDAAVTNIGRRATRNLPSRFSEAAESEGRIHTSYAPPPMGLKSKDLVGIPWMVAFALRADGWYLRQDIIWHKPNPMPESVTDRCTKAHEYLFLLSKSERYFYDAEAIAEDAAKAGQVLHSYGTGAKDRADANATNDRRTRIGLADWNQPQPSTRNKRSVWTVATAPFAQAHFATFPPELIKPAILAGTSARGCCVRCAAPWERITARSRSNESGSGRSGRNPTGKGGPNAQHAGTGDDIRNGPVITTATLGWYPACDHDGLPALPAYPEKPGRAEDDGLEVEAAHDAALVLWRAQCREIDQHRRALCDRAAPIPTKRAVVLDPFGGAGTTGLVADREQRAAILIELNPQYAAMARQRIFGDAPLFAAE